MSSITFVPTQRGGTALIFDGYRYNKVRCNNDKNVTYWRCSKNRNCPGRAVTVDNRVKKTNNKHNHPPEAPLPHHAHHSSFLSMAAAAAAAAAHQHAAAQLRAAQHPHQPHPHHHHLQLPGLMSPLMAQVANGHAASAHEQHQHAAAAVAAAAAAAAVQAGSQQLMGQHQHHIQQLHSSIRSAHQQQVAQQQAIVHQHQQQLFAAAAAAATGSGRLKPFQSLAAAAATSSTGELEASPGREREPDSFQSSILSARHSALAAAAAVIANQHQAQHRQSHQLDLLDSEIKRESPPSLSSASSRPPSLPTYHGHASASANDPATNLSSPSPASSSGATSITTTTPGATGSSSLGGPNEGRAISDSANTPNPIMNGTPSDQTLMSSQAASLSAFANSHSNSIAAHANTNTINNSIPAFSESVQAQIALLSLLGLTNPMQWNPSLNIEH